MNIYLYGKITESLECFEAPVKLVHEQADGIYIRTEVKRAFRELDQIQKGMLPDDICMVCDLSSLGSNDERITDRLLWFAGHNRLLVLCSMPQTYEYGISQPINRAILQTIVQSLQSRGKKAVPIGKRKPGAGRNRVDFPDDWPQLYEKWERKEISSKEFLALSGLKKATFYNLITEYRALLELNQYYSNKYSV